MCMSPSKPAPPPPPPAAPPVLEQTAPKSATDSGSKSSKKRKGLSQYKIDTSKSVTGSSNKLGGIPKKSGAGM